MKNILCEICGGDGTFKAKDGTTLKAKDGTIKGVVTAVPPYPKEIDLRSLKSFHWRCMKCRFKK